MMTIAPTWLPTTILIQIGFGILGEKFNIRPLPAILHPYILNIFSGKWENSRAGIPVPNNVQETGNNGNGNSCIANTNRVEPVFLDWMCCMGGLGCGSGTGDDPGVWSRRSWGGVNGMVMNSGWRVLHLPLLAEVEGCGPWWCELSLGCSCPLIANGAVLRTGGCCSRDRLVDGVVVCRSRCHHVWVAHW